MNIADNKFLYNLTHKEQKEYLSHIVKNGIPVITFSKGTKITRARVGKDFKQASQLSYNPNITNEIKRASLGTSVVFYGCISQHDTKLRLGFMSLQQKNKNSCHLETKRGYKVFDCTDLQCEILPLSFDEISKAVPGEPSATIRERVIKARKIQEERFNAVNGVHCNAQMNEKHLREYCTLSAESHELLRSAMERLQLSARAYTRILKVARTIADLEASPSIQQNHIAEAVGYRNLDRENWAER